jgi:hypothetical protein
MSRLSPSVDPLSQGAVKASRKRRVKIDADLKMGETRPPTAKITKRSGRPISTFGHSLAKVRAFAGKARRWSLA